MATELVADQIGAVLPAVPTGMLITWADFSIIGIPLWFFIESVCLLVFLIGVGFWWLRVSAMSDVAGFRDGGMQIKNGSPIIAWRLNNDLRLYVSALTYSSGCVSFEDVNARDRSIWIHHNKAATIVVGGRPGVIVSEGYAFTRDLSCESALIGAITKHNSETDDPKQQIQSFQDWQYFGRRLMEQKFPDGIPAASYRQLDPSAMDKMMPKNNTSKFFGAMLYQDAQELLDDGEEPEGFFSKYAPLIACSLVAIILVCAAWLFPIGG